MSTWEICWKYFHSIVLESVGRDYCKKMGVRIFVQNILAGLPQNIEQPSENIST